MLSVTSVKVPTNVLNIQTQSQEIINFQPIPKEVIFEAFFGKEEKYDESIVLARPEEESQSSRVLSSSLRRLLFDDSEQQVDQTGSLVSLTKDIDSGSSVNSAVSSFELTEEKMEQAMFLLGALLTIGIALIILLLICKKIFYDCCPPRGKWLCLRV